MNKLNWKKSDKHYVSKKDNFIFRLKYDDIGVYGSGKCYSLQVRQVTETDFKYISYAFVIRSDGYNCINKSSVDRKLWNNIEEILHRTEMILEDNMYI
jgi:hypothetical protein